NPNVRVIAVEPQKGHRLPGLKSFAEASQPEILDWDVIDDVVQIDDGPAYDVTLRLHQEDALMVGPSTGAIVAAVLQTEIGDAVTVGVSPDSSFKYASYFKELLVDEGLPQA
ncbi:MAG: hypothetical protein ABFR89_08345, partial [Actinomycetota bacterium]